MEDVVSALASRAKNLTKPSDSKPKQEKEQSKGGDSKQEEKQEENKKH